MKWPPTDPYNPEMIAHYYTVLYYVMSDLGLCKPMHDYPMLSRENLQAILLRYRP